MLKRLKKCYLAIASVKLTCLQQMPKVHIQSVIRQMQQSWQHFRHTWTVAHLSFDLSVDAFGQCLSKLSCVPSLPSARQHPSYGDCLEVKREYYQNCFVLGCVTPCSQSAAHLYEQFLQVQQIGFVTLGPFHHA